MCQGCADAVRQYYPSLPDAEFGDFLMSVTAFPFGDHETVQRQLKEIWEETDGTIDAAYAYVSDEMYRGALACKGNEEYDSWSSHSGDVER